MTTQKLIGYTAIVTALFCTVSFSAPFARTTRQATDCSVPNNDYELFLKTGLRALDETLNVRSHFTDLLTYIYTYMIYAKQ